jgi:hypothetical protein
MLTLPRYEWIEPRTVDALLAHLGEHASDSLVVGGRHRCGAEPEAPAARAALRRVDRPARGAALRA